MNNSHIKIVFTPGVFDGIAPDALARAFQQLGCRLEVTAEANTFRVLPARSVEEDRSNGWGTK